MTGTAVLSAALTCIWFKVTVFTRGMSGVVREEMLKKREYNHRKKMFSIYKHSYSHAYIAHNGISFNLWFID